MKDNIIEQVKENIYNNNLIENNDIIVVGLSGGPDSVFLLHALYTLKEVIKKEKNISYELHVAHVNHMIREEASSDANLARSLSNDCKATFHLLEFDVESEAKRLKIGTEECGRNVRYEFFNQVKSAVGATKIAVAHNLEDNAETILMNFIRGAGIKGLSGMDIISQDLIRPLLNISKKSIIKYLGDNNIEYAVDKTNLTNDYTRNRIRNDLIKKIETEYNPNFINAVNRMATINKMDYTIINNAVESVYNDLEIVKESGKISLNTKKFNKNAESMRYRLIRKILYELLGNTQNVEMVHIKDTCKLIEANITGKQYILGSKYKVVIEKKNIAVFVKNV